jgi:hypothetical protein
MDMKFLITNETNRDCHQIVATDWTAARHWVINHVDLSLNWSIHRVLSNGVVMWNDRVAAEESHDG